MQFAPFAKPSRYARSLRFAPVPGIFRERAAYEARRTASVDVLLQLQIETANVASGQVSGFCLYVHSPPVCVIAGESTSPREVGESGRSFRAFRPDLTASPVLGLSG